MQHVINECAQAFYLFQKLLVLFQIAETERQEAWAVWLSGKVLGSYSEGTGFEIRSGYRSLWLFPSSIPSGKWRDCNSPSHHHFHLNSFPVIHSSIILQCDALYGLERGTRYVIGSSTMLQAGRSQFRFPMRSLDFSIDAIIPAVLRPWVRLIF
jgi:hypothetical protein